MLNLGVIGCGYWGINYVRLLHELPSARLVSACDVSPQRQKVLHERFPLLSVTGDADELLQSRWIDAVVIATPATTHYDLVKRALLAGKHVLVEKPMTTNVEEAEELACIAQAVGRTLMVGLTFYYNAGMVKMKELMDAPSFGTPYYLHLTRTNLGIVRQDVSVIWDLAAHDLAICQYLLDQPPVWVQANASTVLEHRLEDVAFLTLGYPNNVIANIHVSWVDPNKVREVVAVGSQRRIVFDDTNPSERVRIYEKGIAQQKVEADSFGEYKLLVCDGDIISPRIATGEPLRAQVEHWLDCIQTGETPQSHAGLGAANVRALAAIDRSLALGSQRVPLNEELTEEALGSEWAEAVCVPSHSISRV